MGSTSFFSFLTSSAPIDPKSILVSKTRDYARSNVQVDDILKICIYMVCELMYIIQRLCAFPISYKIENNPSISHEICKFDGSLDLLSFGIAIINFHLNYSFQKI